MSNNLESSYPKENGASYSMSGKTDFSSSSSSNNNTPLSIVFSLDELKKSYNHTVNSPCFKNSFLWASGVALLLAAHRFKNAGTMIRATSDAVLGFYVTFGSQWYFCRRAEMDRKISLQKFFEKKQDAAYFQELRDVKRDIASGISPELKSPIVSDEELLAEIEKITSYDLPEVQEGPTKSITLK